MSWYKRVTVEVPHEAIIATQGMDGWGRRSYMTEHGYICDSHLYGYGVYGQVDAVDANHISYEIGTSCD